MSVAIHRRVGSRLKDACAEIPEVQPGVRCFPGETQVTKAYDLPAQYVIHTVGPVYSRGEKREAELLAQCYRSCLMKAAEIGAESVAFPAISTGTYGYPKDKAADIAVRTVDKWLRQEAAPERVVFCCFEQNDAV